MRAKVARALPERVALDLTARLELRGVDWSRTRAFAHPAENQGYVRLNLRGRERDGIVAPEDADALLDEIARGLLTFVDLDGEPAVASVDARRRPEFARGDRADLLPDLVVRWTDRPAVALRRACAPTSSAPCTATASAAVARATTPRATRGRWSCRARPSRTRPRDRPGWRTSPPPRPRSRASTVDGVCGEPLLQRPARAR